MARILLIASNRCVEPFPVYPLGMSMVAEAARRRGHEVTEWDALSAEAEGRSIDEAIAACRPEIVGVSVRNIDNTDSVRTDAYVADLTRVTEAVRGRTDVPLVLGGAGFSLFPDRLFALTGADYGVVGEGERLFADLADAIASGRAPGRGVLRAGGAMSGGEVPIATRDASLVGFYLREGGMGNVQTKRGCPHRCAYCTYPCLEGAAYRFRPAGDVVDEISMLRDRYGVDYISFTDSVFNDAQGRYLEVAEEMVRRDVVVPWMAFFRPADVGREALRLLRRSGLAAVEWGTDCSSDTTLEAMRKDFTWDDVVRCTALFAEAGVSNAHFVIFGGPGETEGTLREGLENVRGLGDAVVFAFRGVRILPGTEVERLALDAGVIGPGTDLLAPVFYHSSGVSPEAVDAAIRKAFAGERNRVYSSDAEDALRVRTFHRLGRRGPIWDLILAKGGRAR